MLFLIHFWIRSLRYMCASRCIQFVLFLVLLPYLRCYSYKRLLTWAKKHKVSSLLEWKRFRWTNLSWKCGAFIWVYSREIRKIMGMNYELSTSQEANEELFSSYIAAKYWYPLEFKMNRSMYIRRKQVGANTRTLVSVFILRCRKIGARQPEKLLFYCTKHRILVP